MRFRVLFVDDEPKILLGLHRMLRNMRSEWEMVFAENGLKALRFIKEKAFHAVVSDMRMPGMDGGTLLSEVRRHNPGAVRIILSGYNDEERVMKTVVPAHQFLSKPVSADQLVDSVRRSFLLRRFLANRKLRHLVSGVESLPTPSALYRRVVAELESPRASVATVAGLIGEDSAMVAETLKLVNSSFFGIATHVADVTNAVRLLGFERIKTLVLQVGLFRHFSGNWSVSAQLETINRQCRNIGALASSLARVEGLGSRTVEEAHCAGILSQIGAIVLLDDRPQKYAAILDRWKKGGISLGEAQAKAFGASQSELGAYLLGLWGFGDPVVEAVAFCQRPILSPSPCSPILPILHFASAVVRPDGIAPPSAVARNPDLDLPFLSRTGNEDRLSKWRKVLDSLKRTFDEGRAGAGR